MSQEKFMKMDDDIVRQAALRRQRRQHGGRDQEVGGFNESISGASTPMSVSLMMLCQSKHEHTSPCLCMTECMYIY